MFLKAKYYFQNDYIYWNKRTFQSEQKKRKPIISFRNFGTKHFDSSQICISTITSFASRLLRIVYVLHNFMFHINTNDPKSQVLTVCW